MDSSFLSDGIPLERLLSGPVEWSGPLPTDRELWSAPELRFADSPDLAVRATPSTGGGVHVTGRVVARLCVECRRCLKEMILPVHVELDLWFEPEVRSWEEEEKLYGLEAEAANLDLLRALREELLLAVPEFVVCRDDCRGLCPRCGADLNDSPCRCVAEEEDPRWDALRRLRKSESGTEVETDS